MNKVSLKLHEFYSLDAELNGVVNQQNGEVVSKGLLSEKIKLTTKYWLSDLAKKVASEKDAVEKLKDELIKKHGTPDEQGNISIQQYTNIVRDEEGKVISAELTPEFASFNKDFNDLLQEEKELEYKPFKLEEFDSVESEGIYNTFFKLVEVGE